MASKKPARQSRILSAAAFAQPPPETEFRDKTAGAITAFAGHYRIVVEDESFEEMIISRIMILSIRRIGVDDPQFLTRACKHFEQFQTLSMIASVVSPPTRRANGL